MSKKPYLFKFDEELLEALKKEAKKEMRPFNNYVEVVLKKHITEATGKKFK